MEELLKELVEKNRKFAADGNVANYIPELDKADKNALGIYVTTLDGQEFFAGDYNTKFTIQSISKIISLMLAILDNGEEYVFSKVGMEPSGDPFNSIRKLETSSRKKPYNPMINAGAIAVASMIKGKNEKERFGRLLDFAKLITEDDSLDINYKIYCGESDTGFRNFSMAYFLKGDGIIEGNVNEALTVYFKQCSIEGTAKTISTLGKFLANDGVLGEFAVKVGIPSKSGVGGGICSVVPSKMGIGVYGPSLDKKGNSLAGVHLLADLSEELSLNIF